MTRKLAEALAGYAVAVRESLEAAFGHQGAPDAAFWTEQFHTWREPLNVTNYPMFCDVCAQTAAYWHFARAWLAHHRHGPWTSHAERYAFLRSASEIHPLVNHLLALKLSKTGATLLDNLVNEMDRIAMESEPSVDGLHLLLHIFEDFLGAYDTRHRKAYGVYYTPRRVVRAMVKHVHHCLQREFGLVDGLASADTWGDVRTRVDVGVQAVPDEQQFVRILDPATGTGTFLVETIRQMYGVFEDKAKALGWSSQELADAWSSHVRKCVLPNLVGYEVMLAPFAAAHVILILVLAETGFRWEDGDIVHVHLTNALGGASIDSGEGSEPSAQRQVVDLWKSKPGFTVVLGNPPYQESSTNKAKHIENLMARYKVTIRQEEAQIKSVSNDYVKFLRLAQDYIERSGAGIISMVTANAYIDGPLFRDLRQDWLRSFDVLQVLNLHGSGRRGDRERDDENIFRILQGVAICRLTLCGGRGSNVVQAGHLWGERRKKLERLNQVPFDTLVDQRIEPVGPLFAFQHATRGDGLRCFSLPDIFGTGDRKADRNHRWGGGFKTRQDKFTVAFTPDDLEQRITDLAAENADEAELRAKYRLCRTSHFNFRKAQAAARSGALSDSIRRVLYRPFDYREMIWHRSVLCEPQEKINRHFTHDNICLVSTRLVTDDAYRHVAIASGPVEVIYLSNSTSTNAYVFPLYTYPGGEEHSRQLNISDQFLKIITDVYNRSVCDDRVAGPNQISARQIMHYIFGMLQCVGFRQRYATRLKGGFPEIPIPRKFSVFQAIAEVGGYLAGLSLTTNQCQVEAGASTFRGRDRRVSTGRAYPAWCDGCVYINDDSRFVDVDNAAWHFRIGKYQVLRKWLRDRRGRMLSQVELHTYSRIVHIIHEMMALCPKLDQIIHESGGWMAAFLPERL